jgi:hypothetical protein
VRRPRRSGGQALPEFALIAPLFFLLLFGIIEAGRFIYYYEVLSNATREGARYAIVHSGQTFNAESTGPDTGTPTPPSSDDPTGENVVQHVRDSAIGLVGSAITVDRCWWTLACDFATHGDAGYAYGSTVTVRATYTYSPLLPLVPLPNITVTAESSLVITN